MNPPSALRIWIGGALAAFIDGFIDGMPIGAPVGMVGSIADGSAEAVTGWADWKNIAISGMHIFAVSMLAGLSDVRAWKKDNPFPNIFSGDATPPPQQQTQTTQ